MTLRRLACVALILWAAQHCAAQTQVGAMLGLNQVFTGTNTFTAAVGSCAFNNGAAVGGVCASTWGSGDIGSQIVAALATFTNGCGELYVMASPTVYSDATTVVLPRCVHLHGANAMASRIQWTPTSGWAFVIADNTASLDNNWIYQGAIEDITLYGPGTTNTSGAIYLGGSDNGSNSPPISIDPATNYGDHVNLNRVRIMRAPGATAGFNVGVQWGDNAWSDTIFQSSVAYSSTAGLYFPGSLTNSGEDISVLNSSISNNVGIGLLIATGNNANFTVMNSSFDFNGPTATCAAPPYTGPCTWQIQNGTSSSQQSLSLVNSYVTAPDHWFQNYGRSTLSGDYFTGGSNSSTPGYLIDNESSIGALTVIGGQFFNGGSGTITNAAGYASQWVGVLTTGTGSGSAVSTTGLFTDLAGDVVTPTLYSTTTNATTVNATNMVATGTITGATVNSTGPINASAGTITGAIVNSTGAINASSGTITGATVNSTGNMTAASNIVSTSGNITATTGNVTAGGGANVVYRCTSAGAVLPAGALTIVTGTCGASTDTGLRVK